MKKTLLAALIGFSSALTATATYAEDLLQVYEIATANDPTVLKAKAQADAQAYESDRALSALLPQLGLSLGYEKTDATLYEGNDTTGYIEFDRDTDVFSRGISLSQTLFDLGAWNSLGIADKQALQANAQYDFARQDLIVRVAEGYFNVLSAIEHLSLITL